MSLIVEGNLVDVISDRIYPARVTVESGRIVDILEIRGSFDRYILPGLIDSHVHVESSLLVPSRFAEAAVPHGVTGVISDPHEIANVLGIEGVELMIEDGEGVPLHFHFAAPSCVPATPFESSGAIIGPEEIDLLLARDDVVALAEMMNFPGVLNEDPDVMAKIDSALSRGKPVDGHAPGLGGEGLEKYISAGITTDHECTSFDEAYEKASKGMFVQIRNGSASKNMEDLIGIADDFEFFLATDDMHAGDMIDGYMDRLLSKAVSLGVDPLRAIKAASLWPSRHYNLNGGYLDLDMPADMVIVSDLRDFNVEEVYIGGELVAKDGKVLFEARPKTGRTSILQQDWSSEDFHIPASGEKVKARIIRVLPDQIVSVADEADMVVANGRILADPERDISFLAVVNRYRPAPPSVALVSGFGLKKGGMASTIAHDSHNIIAVANDPGTLAHVIKGVSVNGGYFATDGARDVSLPLPVAGLMSTEKAEDVAAKEREVTDFVRTLGCHLHAPFMTMGFQSLLVLPNLKLGDRGLFDSVNFRFVDVVLE